MMFAADVICAHLRSSVRLHQRTSYSVIHLRVIRHRFRSSFLFKFFTYYFFQVYSGMSLDFSFTRVACRCLCGSALDLLIANRLQRALFGQSASSAVASTNQGPTQLKKPAQKTTIVKRTYNNCGHMRRLKATFSNSEEATKVGLSVGQNDGASPPSPQ